MINYKILFILLLLIFPFDVNAASGCCSHHGGVDCTRKQSNGNVICNDGWTGSSCSYSGMVKCQNYNPIDESEEDYDDSDYNDSSSSGEILVLLGLGGAAIWAASGSKKGK